MVSIIYSSNLNHIEECQNNFIREVWNDFNTSPTYKSYIERLLEF